MPSSPASSHYLAETINIAKQAGQLILSIYQTNKFKSYTKKDNTPVTSADLKSHQLICKLLTELTPDLPVLSEEQANIAFKIRQRWQSYWLIDPLDGTQEFISKSGDFSTSIAYIENHQPVLGVVHAPVRNITYYAIRGAGAWKIEGNSLPKPISSKRLDNKNRSTPLIFTVSHRQHLENLSACLSEQWLYQFIPLGSASLKACLVAEGRADCYLRVGPTGEWDTAAAECIIKEAGGAIFATDLSALTYNCRETLTNPNFVVVGDKYLPWSTIIPMLGV